MMDLSRLGARQKPNGKEVDFGVYLPLITQAAGYEVAVRIIHEDDQFLQSVPSLRFPLGEGVPHPEYGSYWAGTVDFAAAPPAGYSANWGRPGRYLYRYEVTADAGDPARRRVLDWVIDPYAREYGPGKMSSFTLDYQPYAWSAQEAAWKVPEIADLAVYELHLGEFNNGIAGAIDRLDYLADLGVNCIEVMPVSNVVESVEWGFQPIGYFGIDDRYGRRKDMQAFVDEAHRRGIAVVLDVVFGHTGESFPYWYLYDSLGLPNPFHGSDFGTDFGFGRRTRFGKAMVDDFFFTVSVHLLDCYHVDGFRYDCVPEYWDPKDLRGYHDLAYSTYQEARRRIGLGQWARFAGGNGFVTLVQCAEQLDDPAQALWGTYGNATWQDRTLGCAQRIPGRAGDGLGGALREFGFRLGADGFPRAVTLNGESRAKAPFQYLENHDHGRFINAFGCLGEGLFQTGNRDNWFKLQPYLIAWLLGGGVPMLWQGQELCQNNSLPPSGLARVRLLRPVAWEFFYDAPGKGILSLTRNLLRIRKGGAQYRRGEYYFFNDWYNFLSRGILLYRRRLAQADSFVAVNFGDSDREIYIPFDRGGDYREELHGLEGLGGVASGEWRRVVVPGNYGRVWTGP